MSFGVKTAVFKSPFHKTWVAESDVDLTERTLLRIVTIKTSSGALITRATRQTDEGNGMISHMMFSDFSKVYAQSRERVTEKAVRTQHEGVLSNLKDIIADCEAFYAAKVVTS